MKGYETNGMLQNVRSSQQQPSRQKAALFMEKPVIYEDILQLNDSAGILTGPQLHKNAMVEVLLLL